MKRKLLLGTLLCGMMVGSVVVPNVVSAAEDLRTESSKKKKFKLKFKADYGQPKSIEIDAINGHQLNINQFVPKGYSLANGQSDLIMITKHSSEMTIDLAANTRWDMIQFMGGRGVYTRSIEKHTGEKIVLEDYEKFVPKGYMVDTSKQTTFVSGNDRWGQTFHVYIKPIEEKVPVTNTIEFVDEKSQKIDSKTVTGLVGDKVQLADTENYQIVGNKSYVIKADKSVSKIKVKKLKIEKEIQFVTDDGVSISGFSAFFDLNGQLVIDQDKIPEGYEIEQTYKQATDDGKKVVEIKLFKTFKNTVQFVTPNGEIVATEQISGRPGHEVIVQAPEGYEYPDTSFKIFNILSEDTTQKVVVMSLEESIPDKNPDPSPELPIAEPNIDETEEDEEEESQDSNNSSQEQTQDNDTNSSETPNEADPNTGSTDPTEIKPDISTDESGSTPEDNNEGEVETDQASEDGDDKDETESESTSEDNANEDVSETNQAGGEVKPDVSESTEPNLTESEKPAPNEVEKPITPDTSTNETVEPVTPDIPTPDENVDEILVENINTQVVTHGQKEPIKLFDINGNQLDHSLDLHTDWKVDQKMKINGEEYYRVSQNGWIKASDVLEYDDSDQTVTTNDKIVTLYDSKGNVSEHRSLAGNTEWLTDKTAFINGKKYYRVSLNEWVLAADLK